MADERRRKKANRNRLIWKGNLEWEEQESKNGGRRKTRAHPCKIFASMLDDPTEQIWAAENPEKKIVEFLDRNISVGVDYASDDFLHLKIELKCDRKYSLAKYMRSSNQIGLIQLLVQGRGLLQEMKHVLLISGGITGLSLQARIPKDHNLWSAKIQRLRNRHGEIQNAQRLPPPQPQAPPNLRDARQREPNLRNEADPRQDNDQRAPLSQYPAVEGAQANPPRHALAGARDLIQERNVNEVHPNRRHGPLVNPLERMQNPFNVRVGLVLPPAMLQHFQFQPRGMFHGIYLPQTPRLPAWDEEVENCVIDQLDEYD